MVACTTALVLVAVGDDVDDKDDEEVAKERCARGKGTLPRVDGSRKGAKPTTRSVVCSRQSSAHTGTRVRVIFN